MRSFLVLFCLLLLVQAEAVNYGAVVFSELMVDPEPPVGLPDAEYIEICNRSDTAVSLKGWTLLYGEKPYPLPASMLSAGEYLVLCAKTSVSAFPSGTNLLGMSSFPSLLNSGKLMALVSPTNDLVCCLDYSDSWYGSGFKANGGWSLECLDLSNFSGAASNWTASMDASGGTPGRVNSVSAENPSLEEPFCSRLYVPSPNTIEIHFSGFLQGAFLKNCLNYSVSPSTTLVLSATPGFPDTRVVTLTLSDTLVSETTYNLSGFPLPDTTLLLGLPEKPLLGSLQLNEILFNPLPGGCDYVEFVNVGTKCVDLSQVWLTNRLASGELNAGKCLSEKPLPCMPGSYWLLSESPDSVCAAGPFPLMPNALKISGFPSLPDDAGNVCLITTSAEVLDERTYTEKMHFALIANREGVALE
ncbi:MAG: lamin tail domain-containing protein, partial [Bacteroidia bacterium]|nr:lamin tail domain-containing protein [Bacteroidia bacterium]